MATESSDQPVSMGIEEATDALMKKHQQQVSDSESDDDAATDENDEDERNSREQPDEDSELDEDVETEDDDESDDDSDDEELDDEDSDSDDDSDDNNRVLFEIEGEDGEKTGVDLEEARKGYLRQQDYTKKTQAVASERKEVESLKEDLTQQKKLLTDALSQIAMSSDEEMKEFVDIDWVKLEKEDPYDYEEKARRYDAVRRRFEQAQEHQKQLQAEYEKEVDERVEAMRKEEFDNLLQKAPEFDPKEGGEELHKSLLQAAQERYGFEEDELKQIFDHRALLVLRDAQKYHEMSRKVQRGKKKAEKVPRNIKPGASKSRAGRQSKEREKLRSRAKQTGSIDDALNFLMRDVNKGRR